MDFESWKTALIKEIEVAAEGRAERAVADPQNAKFGESQKALFDLADQLRALPPDHAKLAALFHEESEFSNLTRATPGEPEARYRDAKEDLLQAYGIEREPFATVDQFLDLLRNRVDETISEYRLRA